MIINPYTKTQPLVRPVSKSSKIQKDKKRKPLIVRVQESKFDMKI